MLLPGAEPFSCCTTQRWQTNIISKVSRNPIWCCGISHPIYRGINTFAVTLGTRLRRICLEEKIDLITCQSVSMRGFGGSVGLSPWLFQFLNRNSPQLENFHYFLTNLAQPLYSLPKFLAMTQNWTPSSPGIFICVDKALISKAPSPAWILQEKGLDPFPLQHSDGKAQSWAERRKRAACFIVRSYWSELGSALLGLKAAKVEQKRGMRDNSWF